MIRYARLSPGEGFAPGRALLYYAQRAVTLPLPRRALSAMIAAGVRARHGGGAGPASPAQTRRLQDLRRDGLVMLPPLVDEATLDAMVDYFHRQPVLGAGDRETPLSSVAPGAIAAYSLARVMNCPGMLGLLNSETITDLASSYLSCTPTLSSVGVRWSMPGLGAPQRTQNYHRDLDEWRFLKLFVYLTDVDEGSGPHCYVHTSHNSAFGISAKAYAEPGLEARFGRERMRTIVGPRGTTFAADTIGIHRGQAPTERPRLLLQAQYSILPVYAFSYEPVEAAGQAARTYINRLITKAPAPEPVKSTYG